MKLETVPTTPYDIGWQPSGATLSLPPNPPVSLQKQRHPDKLDLGSPVSDPSLPTDTTASLDTPLDNSSLYAWPGFANIYVPPHLSGEVLLAALGTGMKEEPMSASHTSSISWKPWAGV